MAQSATSNGNGRHGPSLSVVDVRKPDVRTAESDARMDLRVARLDLLTRLNQERQWAYRIGQAVYEGYIDRALDLCGQFQREAVEEIEKLRARSA
jgi:hypothetical protein